MPSYKSVAVIGAGAWGTALAGVAARAGRDVVLYARSSASAAQIEATRANPKLAGARLDPSVRVTDDMAAETFRTSRINAGEADSDRSCKSTA